MINPKGLLLVKGSAGAKNGKFVPRVIRHGEPGRHFLHSQHGITYRIANMNKALVL